MTSRPEAIDLDALTGYLLGVGCRIGEALAVSWDGGRP
jgi:hypothetical protein